MGGIGAGVGGSMTGPWGPCVIQMSLRYIYIYMYKYIYIYIYICVSCSVSDGQGCGFLIWGGFGICPVSMIHAAVSTAIFAFMFF